MVASYVLPASAMTHGHHGHGHSHSHSHSHSPGRSHSTNASRSLRQERPRGAMHTYSYSDALHEYNQHAGNREQDAMPPYQKQPYTAGPSGLSEEHIPSPIDPYDPPRIDTNLPPHNHNHNHHDHHHDQHHDHGHSHANVVTVQPRSRITNFILPFVLRWPLLHTIMADKDSRRIFYFMRWAASLNLS
jgi:zinc transporter 5/7